MEATGNRGHEDAIAAGAAVPRLFTAAAADSLGRGGGPSRQRRLAVHPPACPRRADHDGTPLTDELLLVVFAGVPDLAGLVRCAATCRRWRRLVSAEAAFLCRTPRRPPPGRFVAPLALGFFHHRQGDAAAPRFVAMASASRRFPGLLRQLPPQSLSTLGDGGLFDASSHIVASRNGLVVVDLRRGGGGKHDRALKLCVFNPMNGEVHVLPALGDDKFPGHYACTVLTADDCDDKAIDPPRSSSYFRLVMVYTRSGFTAFRSYSSEEVSWSEEAKVTSARLGQKQMALSRSGIVQHGGRLVHWLTKNVVFMLSLTTLQSLVVSLPSSENGQKFDMENTLLGMSPEGRLCAIQFGHLFLMPANRRIFIRVTTRTDCGWDRGELIQVEQLLPEDVTNVRLWWFCEKSGVIFFSAVAGDTDNRRNEMFALSLKTRVVEKPVSLERDGDPWGQVHGYEMSQTAYLASLAEP
ncbi:unnamed protein product [Urochloa decumbens]|uniref:F-box domain-containing protein n=1 Tax=Urochloa decumbens TaxID=240449 RepID=A0ABC9C142_9POAL